jgi:hypothetical protein
VGRVKLSEDAFSPNIELTLRRHSSRKLASPDFNNPCESKFLQKSWLWISIE